LVLTRTLRCARSLVVAGLAWLLLAWPLVARADPGLTRDALDRMSEVLELRIEEGSLRVDDVSPALLVSATPRYEGSVDWFAVRVIEVLQRAFGDGSLRLCEACMAPRAYVEEGRMTLQSGPVSLDEVVRLDEQTRGKAPAARSAIWVEEHRSGVAVRIVHLGTGKVLYAQNLDPLLTELKRSQKVYTMSEELERRARGDSLTQAFVDFALYPGQHLSIDWTEQWGKTNANLSGVTISLFDPVLGIGASHYRRLEFFNILVGGKVILSLPTAAVRAVGDDNVDVLDPIVTGVGVVRVPFGRSNYGVVATASTNAEVGLGISLMNISLLPVIP